MEWISGNIFIRPNKLDEVGTHVEGHAHKFDHTTIVFKGAVHVRAWKPVLDENGQQILDQVGTQPATQHVVIDNEVKEVPVLDEKGEQAIEPVMKPRRTLIGENDFEAPAHFLVHKDVEHEITATAPDTEFWCVYSHRTPQGKIVQIYDGWNEPYQ